MSEHAFFSPSSSYRILMCPPSAKKNAELPDQASPYTKQGTDAHAVCAYLVEKALGRRVRDPTEDLDYYDSEMQECAEGYCSYIMEQLEEARTQCNDPEILIEQKVDFSRWVKGGFGTADCIIVSDGTLHVVDFKYGTGVPVSAETKEFGGNPQLMCYSLGALELYKGIYDFNTVRMHIYQPRLGNISTYEMTVPDLMKWADEVLSPAAALALKGEGEYRAGDHCRFCKVKATCRKRAEYNLELARYDFRMPDTLEDTEIAAILERAGQLASWVSDVKDYALAEAQRGKHFPGWKVVEGRSNRKYTDEKAAAAVVENAGFDPYERKILGITAMTKLLGKARFEELLGGLTAKPQGKPTLVPESDRRPAMKTSAQEDFKE